MATVASTIGSERLRRIRKSLPFVTAACAVVGTTIAAVKCSHDISAEVTTVTQTSTANVVISSTYEYDRKRWRSGLLGDKEEVCESRVTVVICNADGQTAGPTTVRVSVPEDCKITRFAADPLVTIRDKNGVNHRVSGHYQGLRGTNRSLLFDIQKMPTDVQIAIGIDIEQPVQRGTIAELFVVVHDELRSLGSHASRPSLN